MSEPHCNQAMCTNGDGCACECGGCTLGVVLHHARRWSAQLRSAQAELDRDGADRAAVARLAGRLLDLAEDVERVRAATQGRFGA